MERRDALKNIGFGTMGVFASTALFGALQSCSSTPEVNWLPLSMTQAEAAQLEKFCEGVCPKTTTPGAIQAGVAKHLDKAFSVLYKSEDVEYMKRGMAVFVKNFDGDFDSATTEEVTAAINGYYKRYAADQSLMKSFREGYGKEGEKSDEWVETFFVTSGVDATFNSYFTSELVGETVMVYDPIPQEYNGCIPYTAGQKSWSSV